MFLFCLLPYFYVAWTSTSASGTKTKSEGDNYLDCFAIENVNFRTWWNGVAKCYDCKEGNFNNCPAPSFGACPKVAGPRYCQDLSTVCHLVMTFTPSTGSTTDGMPTGVKKTCGFRGRRNCTAIECSCFCIQNQYDKEASETQALI